MLSTLLPAAATALSQDREWSPILAARLRPMTARRPRAGTALRNRAASRRTSAAALQLLAWLATARSYLDATVREEPGPIAESWRAKPDFEAQLSLELAWSEATRLAVEAGFPSYLGLLEGGDESLRSSAANLLAALGTGRDRVSIGIRQALERESSDGVRCGLLLALGESGGAAEGRFLRDVLARASGGSSRMITGAPSRANRPLRWGAAVALVRILRSEAPPEAVRVLTEAIQAPPPRDADCRGLPEADRESVRGAILTLLLTGAETAIPAIGLALDRLDPEDLGELLELFVDLAFPDRVETSDPPPTRSAASLTADERAALAALSESEAIWQPWLRLETLLRSRGLPAS